MNPKLARAVRAGLLPAAGAFLFLGFVFVWNGAEGATVWEKAVRVVDGFLWFAAGALVARMLAWVVSEAWGNRDLWAGGRGSGCKE